MTNQVKPKHIEKYIDENTNRTLDTIKNDDLLFEALSEMIVELNPEETVEDFADEFEQDDTVYTLDEFVTRKFDKLVHEETQEIISKAQENTWIEYTKIGMEEYGVDTQL